MEDSSISFANSARLESDIICLGQFNVAFDINPKTAVINDKPRANSCSVMARARKD